MERGIETRHGGHVGQHARDPAYRVHRLGLVQRRQIGQRFELLHHVRREQHGTGEARPAVHHTVADRIDGTALVDQPPQRILLLALG